MIRIMPLCSVPYTLQACLDWADQEWGKIASFDRSDWHEEFERIQNSPVDQVFVALEDDNPVGMAWLLEHEEVASHQHLTPWLSSLVIDPDRRGRGIAKLLIDHIQAYAALGGDEVLFLLTETPAYYFRLGWNVFDTAVVGEKMAYPAPPPPP